MKGKKNWPSILYPLQKISSYGARFAPVPKFQSRKVSVVKIELGWIISSLLTSSQALWTAIDETPLFESRWHGWFLAYLSKHCLYHFNGFQGKTNVFSIDKMNTIDRFLNQKLDVGTLREAMEHSKTVRYVNVSDEELTSIQDRSLPEIIQHLLGNENVNDINVLIIDSYYENLDGDLYNSITNRRRESFQI